MNERIIGDDTLSATSNCLKKKRSAGVDSLPLSLPVLAEYQITFHGRKPFNWPSRLATNLKGTPNKKPPQKQCVWQKAVKNPSPDKHGYKLEYCPGTFRTYNETYGFGKGHPYQVLVSMLHFWASVTSDCGSKSLKSHLMVGILWKNGPINVGSQTVPRTNLQT